MLTLVLGGARSGKSRFAHSLCASDAVNVIATARDDGSDEWRQRIARHRAERPATWKTVEAPLDVCAAIARAGDDEAVLVDCATVWISNLFWEWRDAEREERERRVLDAVDALIGCARRTATTIVVSNEVGSGVVPADELAREFRDVHGRVNQRLAAGAATVVLITAGLPLTLKGAA